MKIDKKITFKEIITDCVIPTLCYACLAVIGVFVYDVIFTGIYKAESYLFAPIITILFMWLYAAICIIILKRHEKIQSRNKNKRQ